MICTVSSGCIGSFVGMVYFPVSHFPRSSVAQRSEQNGLWGFLGGFGNLGILLACLFPFSLF